VSEPVAAIDCGTNTIKLLVATPEQALVRTAEVVRLGQGVDRTGHFDPAALVRTLGVVEEYAGLLARHGVRRVRFCATSATRDAADARDFTDGVRRLLGVEPEVLTGEQEATLSLAGAVGSLPDVTGPVLLVDVGGGSTELVAGDPDGTVRRSCSMDVGSVRLHERHAVGDPPTRAQLEAVGADVDAALAACPVPVGGAATLVGVSGTVTSLAAGVLGLGVEARRGLESVPGVHGARLDADAVVDLVEELLAMTVERRRALPWLHEARADLIGVGGLLLTRVLRHTGARTLVASDHDILDGMAQSLFEDVDR